MEKKPIKPLVIAFLLNAIFSCIEFLGAYWTNSVAIFSDAFHDFGDTFAIGLSLFLVVLSNKPKNKLFSFGYGRLSLIGELLIGIILVASSIYIFTEAIPLLWDPQKPYLDGILIIAIFGLLVNGFAAIYLHNHVSYKNKIITLHFVEDVLGWIAILIMSVLLRFVDYYIMDPILAILISSWIAFSAFKNLKPIVMIFLEASPSGIKIDELEKDICSIEGILSIHGTHIWNIDSDHIVMSTHIVITPSANNDFAKRIKNPIKKKLREAGISQVTIELELPDDACEMKEETETVLFNT